MFYLFCLFIYFCLFLSSSVLICYILFSSVRFHSILFKSVCFFKCILLSSVLFCSILFLFLKVLKIRRNTKETAECSSFTDPVLLLNKQKFEVGVKEKTTTVTSRPVRLQNALSHAAHSKLSSHQTITSSSFTLLTVCQVQWWIHHVSSTTLKVNEFLESVMFSIQVCVERL